MMVLLAGVVTGCGKKETIEDNVYHVGICQLVEHPALDEATRGFMDAMKDKLGTKVAFDLQVADGKAVSCKAITDKFVADKTDLIMANATPALKAATESTGTIPIVATSITDYGTALGIRKWSGITGINATGTSDMAPIDKQADIIFDIVPDAKRVGILYNGTESNSVYQADVMTKELETRGVEGDSYVVKRSEEIVGMAKIAAKECDVIYIPTDNTMAASAELLKNIFLDAGIVMIAGEENLCSAGIATLSISYYNIGYNAGLMAVDILINDREPGLMEIGYASEFIKEYNKDNADKLNITVPEDYKIIE